MWRDVSTTTSRAHSHTVYVCTVSCVAFSELVGLVLLLLVIRDKATEETIRAAFTASLPLYCVLARVVIEWLNRVREKQTDRPLYWFIGDGFIFGFNLRFFAVCSKLDLMVYLSSVAASVSLWASTRRLSYINVGAERRANCERHCWGARGCELNVRRAVISRV